MTACAGGCLTRLDLMPKLSKIEYELLAEFRWSLRQFLRFSERAARAAGVTPQQHQA